MNKIWLYGLIFLVCAGLVGAVSAVVITESPSHVKNGEPITISVSGLSDSSQVSIISEATFKVEPNQDFLFEITNFVMPISLDVEGQISAMAIGVQKGTFSAKKGTTEISVTRPVNGGIFSFSQAQSIPAGTYDFFRLQGTPLPDTKTIVSSIQLSGKKTGPDSSSISFAVNGIKKGEIKVSVFVDGHLALCKTVTIDGDFTPAPSITVTAPNGGESWKRGTTQKVSWDYTGSPGSSVSIVLFKGDSQVYTIASGTPAGSGGSGSFNWKIPSDKPIGTDYRVRVQSTSQSSVKDLSDNYFSIVADTTPTTSIRVTAPNGGESWKRGTTQTISWDYTGSLGSSVKIVLMKGDDVVDTIAGSVSTGHNGKGSYSWPISSSIKTGSEYRISVQSISQSSVKDTSDNYFAIIPTTSITVTAPNGGESWRRGTTQKISWEYTGSLGSSVKIVLLKGNDVVDTIAGSVPIGHDGKGSYSWPISSRMRTGSEYRISVQSNCHPSYNDMSNANFRIS